VTTVAIVIVTYNRADLLTKCLDGLAASTHRPDAVYVVNNASQDHTKEVLDDHQLSSGGLPLHPIHSDENLGGAGGFHLGVQTAYDAGYDRIWLMDDDVVPAPGCLGVLMANDGACLMAVREDLDGTLCEKAATKFDLANPLAVRPKRQSVEDAYASRAEMPDEVPIDNVAFEGFMVKREVIDAVGLPDPRFFIFYDDVDFALRARRAGFGIVALRDAVLVRQLDFNQQHDMKSWKGYYMYRNLFLVHLKYGENVLVRLKPFLITLMVLLLAPLRGGKAEADNVWRALKDARSMAHATPLPPGSGAPPG
jgi:rhamnopyranosyl-N-acetylglucosaminyl-diphospho-decaprenol beta-1,3/1,4-galactofuranosyltransferase